MRAHRDVAVARRRIGIYAKTLGRFVDEVALAVGENDDRPRAVVTAVLRWCDGKRATNGTYFDVIDAELWVPRWVRKGRIDVESMTDDERATLDNDPWPQLWRAVSLLLKGAARAKRGDDYGWGPIAEACGAAVSKLHGDSRKARAAARHRAYGEFRRALEVLKSEKQAA